MQTLFTFFTKTSYSDEEVKRTGLPLQLEFPAVAYNFTFLGGGGIATLNITTFSIMTLSVAIKT